MLRDGKKEEMDKGKERAMKQNSIWVRGWLLVFVLSLGLGTTRAYGAADGWTSEQGGWYYYNDGIRITNEWRKGESGNWFYLDYNGAMVTDSWINSEYYVGADGAMVREAWKYVYRPGEDPNDVEGEEGWFYFLGTGKCVSDTWKKINGKWYHFEEDGAMSYGWYDDGRYYLGDADDGVMKSGWMYLEDDEDLFPNLGESWYWFGTNGEKAFDVVDKKIAGKYYSFDKGGRMLYGWVDVENLLMDGEDDASPRFEDYQYYNPEDGSRVTGWRQLSGPANCFGSGADVAWYYFKNGKPYYAGEDQELAIQTISGQRYCFNEYGEMQHGLQEIVRVSQDGEEEPGVYYFGEADDGVMKTGKQSVYNDEEGASLIYYFETSGSSKGRGITGIRDSCVYKDGRRLDADKHARYQVVTNGEVTRLVNTSGKIQKAAGGREKTLKDSDGNSFTVDEHGEIVSELPAGYAVKGE